MQPKNMLWKNIVIVRNNNLYIVMANPFNKNLRRSSCRSGTKSYSCSHFSGEYSQKDHTQNYRQELAKLTLQPSEGEEACDMPREDLSRKVSLVKRYTIKLGTKSDYDKGNSSKVSSNNIKWYTNGSQTENWNRNIWT